MTRKLATLALLLLAGCASTPRTTSIPPATPAARYEAEAGRDAATVAEMRAAPAPAMPEIVAGRNPTADHDRLIRQGYVRIGTGHYALAETAARDAALRQGRAVGAERVLMYAPATGATTTPMQGEWLEVYYVRFQLPFGATFRDLRASERQALGATGGVAIGSVVSGTPASRANLIAGDVVLKFDGQPIAGRSAFQGLLKNRAGHPVTLTIVRNGETLQRMVRLGAMASGN
ncbi:MAG: PDZ domain-containing protein [Lysobacterales bacterium]